MTTYTWKIDGMRTIQNPEPNYVVEVAWCISGVYDVYMAAIGNRTTLNASQSSTFIPYEQLTEEIVLGWLQNTLGGAAIADLEAKIQADIDRRLTPPAVIPKDTPLPWATS
jgi:hypothetical protein